MWKIYDVTNGCRHIHCNDLLAARRVLACVMREIEANVPGVTITLKGDRFSYRFADIDDFEMVYAIEEVDVWNRVPDNLAKYDYV